MINLSALTAMNYVALPSQHPLQGKVGTANMAARPDSSQPGHKIACIRYLFPTTCTVCTVYGDIIHNVYAIQIIVMGTKGQILTKVSRLRRLWLEKVNISTLCRKIKCKIELHEKHEKYQKTHENAKHKKHRKAWKKCKIFQKFQPSPSRIYQHFVLV